MIDLEIIKGTINDIQELEHLYDGLNDHLASSNNYPGWIKGIYPIRKDAELGISDNSLYVAQSGNVIVGSIILNHLPENAYDQVKWQIDNHDYNLIFVVHTLVVNPDYQKHGIGQALLEFTTKLASDKGMKSIRLDVYENNIPAIHLYEKMG